MLTVLQVLFLLIQPVMEGARACVRAGTCARVCMHSIPSTLLSAWNRQMDLTLANPDSEHSRSYFIIIIILNRLLLSLNIKKMEEH